MVIRSRLPLQYRGAVFCHVAPCPPWPSRGIISSSSPQGVGCRSFGRYSGVCISDASSQSFSYNDALRHKERKLIFNVEGLGRLAAESIGQSLSDVVSLTKLGEGGFNRTFVVALRDGRQVVARVPYPQLLRHQPGGYHRLPAVPRNSCVQDLWVLS